jgi:arginase
VEISTIRGVSGFVVLDAPLDCSGARRGEERAPAALRAAGLLERLGAEDGGVADARIRDAERDPDTGVVGASNVRRAALAIASLLGEVLETGKRPLVLGGDCTLLLGVFQAIPSGSAMWFIDGHADFFDGWSSPTGEAADMDLAILTGNGPPGLLDEDRPLLEPGAVALLGHRPDDLHPDVARENARLDPAIHSITAPEIRALGPDRVGTDAAARFEASQAWLHLDLDVLDEEALPALTYPQPLGLEWEELIELARPLVLAPNLIGLSVADFNPDRDADGTHAARVVEALVSLLRPSHSLRGR